MADSYPVGPFVQEDSVMQQGKPIDYATLARKLGHVFADPALLQDALTHPSLSSSKPSSKISKASPYERLEFLGDRVLGLVVAHWLYALFPQANEGELAKRHAYLVNRDMLRNVATALKLDDDLRLAHGESANDLHKNLAAMSDATEAVIGALYLDAGFEVARTFIKTHWQPWVDADMEPPADPKTALQEYAQGKGLPLPQYSIIERTGPSHAPQFKIKVVVSGFEPVIAEGGSKRVAEKAAAQALLAEIEKTK